LFQSKVVLHVKISGHLCTGLQHGIFYGWPGTPQDVCDKVNDIKRYSDNVSNFTLRLVEATNFSPCSFLGKVDSQ